MFELQNEKNLEIEKLIAITKSDSGISGPILVNAHIRLGQLLAEHMTFNPKDTAVIAILRGGIFLAQGIYMQLGCQFNVFDPKYNVFEKPKKKNIILADSVINTGKTLREIMTPEMYIASCVTNENAVNEFCNRLFTVRVSKNSYVGSNVKIQKGNKGPDTTMRLFNIL